MRKRAKRSEWAKRIAGWEASGESAAEYAKKHSWNPRTLVWWRRQIVREKTKAEVEKGFVEIMPADKTFAAKMPVPKAIEMLSDPGQPHDSVEVILRSGRILRIRTGGDAGALRTLLGVLEEG